jgi:hypothetical protein
MPTTIIIVLVAVLLLGFLLLSATQLRYLQTLTEIAAEKNSTIIFPLPLELLQGFFNLAPPNGTAYGVNGNVPRTPTRS